MTNLFRSPDGSWVTDTQLHSALTDVGAHEARIVYLHTGLADLSPNPQLKREDLLNAIYEVLQALHIPTLLVPTFTFSFCNGEDYNRQTSRSRMGAINEFIRRLPDAERSIDPLMSSALVGAERDLVRDLGTNSIGAGSTFDKLHARGADVKFLFLGTTVSDCFTYTHYVEERLATEYRYDRQFTGRITDGDRTWTDTYTLFVRHKGVVPSPSRLLERELLRRGLLRKVVCGSSTISCLDEADGYNTIVEHLQSDLYAYIAADAGDRTKEFVVNRMVAL